MTHASRIHIPDLPTEHPGLTCSPQLVDEIRAKRDTRPWARMGYNHARLLADTLWEPTPSGGDDGWVIPAAPTSAFRGRPLFFGAYGAAIVGAVERDESYLRRAWRLLRKALSQSSGVWWQPVAMQIVFTADAVWSLLSGDESDEMRALLRRALETAYPAAELKNNIGAGHRKAMIAAGVLLNDRDLVDEAINHPENGLAALMRQNIQEGGFWNEPGVGYHLYALQQLVETFWLCQAIGVDLLGPLGDLLHRACLASFGLLDASLRYPVTGDSFLAGLAEEPIRPLYPIRSDRIVLELGLRFFGDPVFGWALRQTPRENMDSLVYGVADLPSKPPPAHSRAYPQCGASALRAGDMRNFWGSDGFTAYLRFGARGVAHNHFDALALELRAFGREMVADRGRAGWYADLTHDLWHVTTLAHSTVVVDRKSQSGDLRGELLSFVSDDAVSAICACCPNAYPGIRCERALALTDRYLIDDFHVEAPDEHTYHYALHGVGRLASPLDMTPIEGLGLGDGYGFLCNLRSAEFDGLWSATLIQDEKHNPADTGMSVQSLIELRGRLALAATPGVRTVRFQESAIVETCGRGSRFLNLLEPFRGAPRVTSARHVGGQDAPLCVEVTFDDCRDLVCYAPGRGHVFDTEGIKFEGEFLFLRQGADGALQRAVGRGATRLDVGSDAKFRAESPEDFGI